MKRLSVQSTVMGSRVRAGFTLVEIVLSAGIVGIMLSAMLAFFVNALALNQTSRNLTIAVSHAQHILEDIRNASFDNVPEQINRGVWTWDRKAIALNGLIPLSNEKITTTKAGTELLTVTVTVTWSDAAGRMSNFVMMTHMSGA